MKTITAFYKCRCMTSEASIEIRERLEDEDIKDYMQHFSQALSVDHNNRSPRCKAISMEYAKLPAPAQGIGRSEGGNA